MNYSQTPEIVYEDRDIIVCLKPAGTPTQSRQIGVPDMVSILKNHLADQERSKGRKTSEKKASPTPYLAVVHRLDQPVEGLLVFAKTPASARELNRQLNTSAFGKYYAAFVEGIPQPEEGCLENFLVKDGRSNTSRICPENTPGARHAKLHYHVTDILDGNAFVKIISGIPLQEIENTAVLFIRLSCACVHTACHFSILPTITPWNSL